MVLIPLKFHLTFLLVLLSLATFGQREPRNSYGINYSFGQPANFLAFTGGSDLKGSSLEGDFRFYRRLAKRLRFETGIGLHRTNYTSKSNIPPFPVFRQDIRTVFIPALLRLNVSSVFFLQGGFIGDIDIRNVTPSLRQTGLGLGLGFGIEIPIMRMWVIQVNPYLHYNPLWLTSVDPIYQVDRGVRVGIRSW